MSTQPPTPGPPPAPEPGSLRCPRCSAAVGPDQDWCVECGAPARTRLAPTPNWQLPTVAIGAIMLVAGALFAFAFVRLTNDDNVTTTPAAITTAAPVAPPAVVPPVVPPPVTPPAATGTVPATTGTTPATTATAGTTPTTTTTTPGTAGKTTSTPGAATQPTPAGTSTGARTATQTTP